MDTIIPNMPKNPLTEPDDTQYHAKIQQIDEQIEKLNEDLQQKKGLRHEKRSQMVDGQQGRNPVKE